MNLNACYQLYCISEIPLCVVQDNDVLLALPELEKPVFTTRFLELCQIDYNIYAKTHSGPLVMILNPGYYLAIAQLIDSTYLILGPSTLVEFSWSELLPWINAPLFEDNQKGISHLLMSQKPTTAIQFFHTLSLALYMTTGILPDPDKFLPLDVGYLQSPIQPVLTHYMFDMREAEGFHTPYSREIQITCAIENGDIEKLKKLLLCHSVGRLGILSANSERQIRYMFVTAVAVFSRAALRGGLYYEKAYSIADVYCQRMDAMTNLQQIQQLQRQMIEHFCREVSELKTERYTPIIRKCYTYINQHSHEKITLKMLSEHCGMSSRRLSEKFKKETGKSIVDYIHNMKMEEAKLLLQYSEYTLGEISSYLGYSNQSHFISIFRRFYGMTPMQYRNRLH